MGENLKGEEPLILLHQELQYRGFRRRTGRNICAPEYSASVQPLKPMETIFVVKSDSPQTLADVKKDYLEKFTYRTTRDWVRNIERLKEIYPPDVILWTEWQD